jgi:hypothetical protein
MEGGKLGEAHGGLEALADATVDGSGLGRAEDAELADGDATGLPEAVAPGRQDGLTGGVAAWDRLRVRVTLALTAAELVADALLDATGLADVENERLTVGDVEGLRDVEALADDVGEGGGTSSSWAAANRPLLPLAVRTSNASTLTPANSRPTGTRSDRVTTRSDTTSAGVLPGATG